MFDDHFSLFWQLVWKLAATCLVIFFVGIIWANPLTWGLGVLLGGAFTALRLKMMEISITKAVKMEAHKASRYAKIQYIIRYFLAAVVLAVAATVEWFNPIGTMLAMLALKLVTYVQGILDKKFRPEEDFPIVEWEDEEEEEEEAWDRWQTYSKKAGKRMRAELAGGVLKKAKTKDEASLEQETSAAQEDESEQLSLFDENEKA